MDLTSIHAKNYLPHLQFYTRCIGVDTSMSERFTGSVHAHSLNHFAASDKDDSKIVLIFKTPTRIKSGNHLTKDLNFRLFMQNLFRRLSLLALVCTGNSWGLNYKSLLEKAEAAVESLVVSSPVAQERSGNSRRLWRLSSVLIERRV